MVSKLDGKLGEISHKNTKRMMHKDLENKTDNKETSDGLLRTKHCQFTFSVYKCMDEVTTRDRE